MDTQQIYLYKSMKYTKQSHFYVRWSRRGEEDSS